MSKYLETDNPVVRDIMERKQMWAAKKSELKRLHDACKEKEDECRAEMLVYLQQQGTDGTVIKGLGTAYKKYDEEYRIQDMETFAQYMFAKMCQTYNDNQQLPMEMRKPLSDCLLLQQRFHESKTKEILSKTYGADYTPEQRTALLSSMGVTCVDKVDVVIRKA